MKVLGTDYTWCPFCKMRTRHVRVSMDGVITSVCTIPHTGIEDVESSIHEQLSAEGVINSTVD